MQHMRIEIVTCVLIRDATEREQHTTHATPKDGVNRNRMSMVHARAGVGTVIEPLVQSVQMPVKEANHDHSNQKHQRSTAHDAEVGKASDVLPKGNGCTDHG